MNDFNSKLKEVKKIRDKQVRRLSKLLKLLVSAEWDMVSIGNDKRDNISLLAAESVSEASKNLQLAISKLILTEFSNKDSVKQKRQTSNTISSLKKVVLNNK